MSLKAAKEQIEAKKAEVREAYTAMAKELEKFQSSLLAAFMEGNISKVEELLLEIQVLKELPELKEEVDEIYKKASAFSQVFFVEKAITRDEIPIFFARQVVPSITKAINELQKQ